LVKSSLRTCYGCYHDLFDRYGISVKKWPPIRSTSRKHFLVLSALTTYYRFVTRLTRRVPLEHRNSPGFSGIRVTRTLTVYVCFVDRCLSFCIFVFFWPLCFLFFDIRIRIAPLYFLNRNMNTFYWNNSKLRNMLLCVLLNTIIGKDWEHSFVEPDLKHRISI
jgi:hypothetical protein